MTTNRTPLSRAVTRERNELGYHNNDEEESTATEAQADTPGVSARKTRINGTHHDLETPQTTITFEDEHGLLTDDHGRPRPREFWTAKQLGQTPQMHLIKHAITQQLTGGQVQATTEDGELSGALADLGELIEDIYEGPHFQEKSCDALITGAVDDLVDSGMAYWEMLPSADGEFPVAGFKPLPPLQIQHNIDEDTGELLDEPAFYQIPYKNKGGTISVTETEPISLDREQVVVMRAPLSSRSDRLYPQSLALKVREWLELITDVDVHQKRHFADSQLPSGFLHFLGSLDDDDLAGIEQDIAETAGDPHELVTTTSEEDAKWIPVGDSVVDLDAISQQEWYFKLVLAAAGLNQGEIGIIEGSGFSKELPSQVRQIFKKITKPYKSAIFDAQTHQALPRIYEGFSADISDSPLRVDLERFDPLQEQVEREETLKEWDRGLLSLNETRGTLGKEAAEFEMEVDGEKIDLANVPRRIVDLLLKRDRPELNVEDEDGAGGGE